MSMAFAAADEAAKFKRPICRRAKSDNEGDNRHISAFNEQDTCSIDAQELKKALLTNLRRWRMVVGVPISGARLEEIYESVVQEDGFWPTIPADSQEPAGALRLDEPGDEGPEGLEDLPVAAISAEGVGADSFQAHREAIQRNQSSKLMSALALVEESPSGKGSIGVPGLVQTPVHEQSSGSRSPVDPEPQAAWRSSAQGKNFAPSFAKKSALCEVQGASSPSTGTSTTGPTGSGTSTVTITQLHGQILQKGSAHSLDSVEETTDAEAYGSRLADDTPAESAFGEEDSASSAGSVSPGLQESLRRSLAGIPLEATLKDILVHDSRVGYLSIHEFLALFNRCQCNSIVEEKGQGGDEYSIAQDIPGLPEVCRTCASKCDRLSLLDLDEDLVQELKMLVLNNGVHARGCKCKSGGPHTCMTPASKLVSLLASRTNSIPQSGAHTCLASTEVSRRESLNRRSCNTLSMPETRKEPAVSTEQGASSLSAQRISALFPAKIGGERSNKPSMAGVGRTVQASARFRRMSSSPSDFRPSDFRPTTIPETGPVEAEALSASRRMSGRIRAFVARIGGERSSKSGAEGVPRTSTSNPSAARAIRRMSTTPSDFRPATIPEMGPAQ